MLDLLTSHLEDLYSDFQSSGSSTDPLKPFTQSPEIDLHLSESAKRLPTQIGDMLKELIQVMSNTSTSVHLKAIAGGIYSYVFNPFENIDDKIGLLGFVDDALVVFYGMQLIESLDPSVSFKTLQKPEICKAIAEYEAILREDLLTGLKKYSQNISSAIASTDFNQVK
jgi:uncharacterized membrane protein YkvA (DUF1232 family)